jgi:hypothetical protein
MVTFRSPPTATQATAPMMIQPQARTIVAILASCLWSLLAPCEHEADQCEAEDEDRREGEVHPGHQAEPAACQRG